MLVSFLLLAIGLALLVYCGDLLVRGAVLAAENLGISPLVIGLTVVSAGTSMPELLISVEAALSGSPGIAVGNVVGSNIANVFLVLGLPALLQPIISTEEGLRRNLTIMLAATAAFALMLMNGQIGRAEGLAMLVALVAYVGWQVWMARQPTKPDANALPRTRHPGGRVALYLAGGLIGLPIAAQLTVKGAVGLAESFGVSDTVIALTVIAIGTSLPELATTFVAALQRRSAVAIGNVVGSNIFNILGIMGVTALTAPVPVDRHIINHDMWAMLGAAAVLALLGYLRFPAGRSIGIAMLAAYGLYIATLI